MPTPDILYKVVTAHQLLNSSDKPTLELSDADSAFIHFSTQEQYPKIVDKFKAQVPFQPYVILAIRTKDLPGEMLLEASAGKGAFYHLYRGNIPMTAIESTLEEPDVDAGHCFKM